MDWRVAAGDSKKSSLEAGRELVADLPDLNLKEYRREILQNLAEIEAEINKINTSHLSVAGKDKSLDPWKREQQIQNLILQEASQISKNQGGVVSTTEFQKRLISLNFQIYALRHPEVAGQEKGVKLWNLEAGTVQTSQEKGGWLGRTFKVFLEENLASSLELLPSLKQYKQDVEKETGYNVVFYRCHFCTKEQIREILAEKGTVGALLVGDLPAAWYWLEAGFFYPTDLYYMDVDGVWGGEIRCGGGAFEDDSCFTTRSGHLAPEIFVGRLTTPVESKEVSLLVNYFRKNHAYRVGEKPLPHRTLNYDNYYLGGGYLRALAVNYAYPGVTFIRSGTPPTSKKDYLARFKMSFEHHLVLPESLLPWGFYLCNSGYCEIVSWRDVRDGKPQFFFQNLYANYLGDFSLPDYVGGWYVFQESDYGLLALAPTWQVDGYPWVGNSANRILGDFYKLLREEQRFGPAFKDWLSLGDYSQRIDSVATTTLLGDPTLSIFTAEGEREVDCPQPARPIWAGGLEEGGTLTCPFYGLLTVGSIKDVSESRACFPHLSTFELWRRSDSGQYIFFTRPDESTIIFPTLSPDDYTSFPLYNLALPEGDYQWRAWLSDSWSPWASEALRVNFTVSYQPPSAPLITSSDIDLDTGKSLTSTPTFVAREVTAGLSCFPHDLSLSIYDESGQLVQESGWLRGVFSGLGQETTWKTPYPLSVGRFRLEGVVRNLYGSSSSPAIFSFSLPD